MDAWKVESSNRMHRGTLPARKILAAEPVFLVSSRVLATSCLLSEDGFGRTLLMFSCPGEIRDAFLLIPGSFGERIGHVRARELF
jgi:hypothetical protein